MPHIEGSGRFDCEVVGESHYQEALERIAGPKTKEGVRLECSAMLYLEPNNLYDANAVRVEIDGSPVGHIPRELAPELRNALGRLGIHNGDRVGVDAVICGGRLRQSFGVWLDLDMEESELDDEEDEEDEAEVSISYSSQARNAPRQPAPQHTTMPKWEEPPAWDAQRVASVWSKHPARTEAKRPWWKFW